MVGSRTYRNKRGALRGWWKCLPLLVLPFSVIFYEAWLRTQILRGDYERNELGRRLRDAENRIDVLWDKQRHLTRMSWIDAHAPDLGLVEPNPGQIIVVRSAEQDDGARPDSIYSVARSEPGFEPGFSEEALAPLEELTEMD